MEVPTATTLNDIYTEDAVKSQTARWERLLATFKSEYGQQAEFVSRSPGRVNIIGEHIDYSLYEVLPMAVTADVLIAVRAHRDAASPRVRLANVNAQKFPSRSFDAPRDGRVEIDSASHEWTNYFKAGMKGALDLLARKRGGGGEDGGVSAVGMDVVVCGTVPSGGGLSSSAAFVCASALAVLKAQGEERVDKTELVELAIVSERAVGVYSGGMDQSASVLPLRGTALYVTFKPSLSAKNVSFPTTDPPYSFVIAQTFVAADKHVTAPVCYNLRVVEVTLAAAVLAKIFKVKRTLPKDASPLEMSLRGFHDAYFEEVEGVADNNETAMADFDKQLEKLVRMTEDYLVQEDGYTREEICAILGTTPDELAARFMSKFAVRADRFKLRQRALHVFREARRVIRFRALLDGAGEAAGPDLLRELGAVMDDCQASCRDVYECSCPELDELCALARAAGSLGSRLTGAGWGGCSVHLVPADKVAAVKEAWEREYYRKRFPDIGPEKLADAVVVSRPGSGSVLFEVTGDTVV